MNNEEEEKLITSTCPHSIALDYTNGNIFWIDNCNYQLGTSKIDGSLDHFVPTGSNSYFSYGASVYNTHVYWIEAGETSIVDCFEMETSTQNRIYAITGTITRDIQIVHSSNQPSCKPCEALMSEDSIEFIFNFFLQWLHWYCWRDVSKAVLTGDVMRMHNVSVKKAGQDKSVHQFFPLLKLPQPLRPHPPQ